MARRQIQVGERGGKIYDSIHDATIERHAVEVNEAYKASRCR